MRRIGMKVKRERGRKGIEIISSSFNLSRSTHRHLLYLIPLINQLPLASVLSHLCIIIMTNPCYGYYDLWRCWMGKKKADVVLSVNVNLGAEGGEAEKAQVASWLDGSIGSFRIEDWGLFEDSDG
jgi:hypothetical protein